MGSSSAPVASDVRLWLSKVMWSDVAVSQTGELIESESFSKSSIDCPFVFWYGLRLISLSLSLLQLESGMYSSELSDVESYS